MIGIVEKQKPTVVYAFCEPSTAGPLARFHIRRLSEKGLMPGGGIDTPFLCGRSRINGWDIENLRVTREEVEVEGRTCQRCAVAWREAESERSAEESSDRAEAHARQVRR